MGFRVHRAVRLVNTNIPGGWCSPPPQKDRPLHYGPSGSFIIYVPYNKLINVNNHVSLSSVNHYSKLWKLRRSLWEPEWYPVGQAYRCQPVIDLQLVSEWWAVFTTLSFSQLHRERLSFCLLYCLLMPQFPFFSNNIQQKKLNNASDSCS